MMFYDLWMGGMWMHVEMWSLGKIYYSLIKFTILWYMQQCLMHEVILFECEVNVNNYYHT
jgi:hypothetical protein